MAGVPDCPPSYIQQGAQSWDTLIEQSYTQITS